jgi:hypothetical protein
MERIRANLLLVPTGPVCNLEVYMQLNSRFVRFPRNTHTARKMFLVFEIGHF